MLVSTELVLCSLSAAAPHPFPQCHMFSLSPAFICNRVFLRSTYTASLFQPGKQRVGSTLYLSFHFPSQSFHSSPRQKALAVRSDRTGDSCVIPGGAAGQWKGKEEEDPFSWGVQSGKLAPVLPLCVAASGGERSLSGLWSRRSVRGLRAHLNSKKSLRPFPKGISPCDMWWFQHPFVCLCVHRS